jgi:hypothetical protein
MSLLPVVNYGRMERLRLPEDTSLPMNLNTFCILFIVICGIFLYIRYVNINQQRERYHI